MNIPTFIVIGENIHCTRILKRGGSLVTTRSDGAPVIAFEYRGKKSALPIPEPFLSAGDWTDGKVKHCSVAIWQGMRGKGEARQAGIDYLQTLARKQEDAGASFLDLNVDEFSLDIGEKKEAIRWAADIVQKAGALPLSIDSSNEEIMKAGLKACLPARGRAMVNSISLERLKLLDLAASFKPAVVASAAGEKGLPSDTEERLQNLRQLIPLLTAKGIQPSWIHVDPLVYTISTDPNNGRMFLEAVRAIRKEFGPEIHIIGGLSNVSFGMPCRKLINQVFTWLSVEAGGDGGIVDPLQINKGVLDKLDTDSEAFRLASALLRGEDEFGMNFIAAHREGKIAS
ncbi:MAG: dihydropteroate synthase [Lentisphaerae bacterium]|nr:dihydropteroate synthase [Lentisphaerota bacterium]